jgi:hypothetical protein
MSFQFDPSMVTVNLFTTRSSHAGVDRPRSGDNDGHHLPRRIVSGFLLLLLILLLIFAIGGGILLSKLLWLLLIVAAIVLVIGLVSGRTA